MPVFAEQKEPTTFDRVVEPTLNTEIGNTLLNKEDQVLDAESPLDASRDDHMIQEKIETETTSLVVEVSPLSTTPEQHIVIFDWDDTLLASSFLASNGYRLDVDMEKRENYEFVKNELKQLETCVTNLLDIALQRGKVHIITNAETGWVELSAQKFLPSVVPYLSKVTLISARSTYEVHYPESPVKWKYMAMYDFVVHDE
jgi:hypothetical protein